jgi:hypothetical protein
MVAPQHPLLVGQQFPQQAQRVVTENLVAVVNVELAVIPC